MEIKPTNLKDCVVLQPKVFKDHRGYFIESFSQKVFAEKTGKVVNFVQDNESQSQFGTLRGLHMQKGPSAQAKLVRVVKGKVLDVVIDARPDSPTFKQQFKIELSEDNKTQLFIPKGFLHGFSVLSEVAIFSYKCDAYYDKSAEAGVNPLDDDLNIDWEVSKADLKLSEKDEKSPSFKDLLKHL